MRRLLILVAVLVCVAGLYFYWEKPTGADRKGSETAEGPIFECPSKEVSRIELVRPGQEKVAILRDGSEWRIVAPVEDLAEDFAVLGMLTSLEGMKALKTIKKADPAEFGLSEPRLLVKLDQDGRERLVALGNENPSRSGRYVRLDGGPDVHLVESYHIRQIDNDLPALRDKMVLDANGRTAAEVWLSGPQGRVRLVKGEKGWSLAADDGAPVAGADPQAVDHLFGALASARIAEFLDEPPAGQPALTIKIVEGGKKLEAAFWPPAEGEEFVTGRSSRHGQAFQVEKALWDGMALSADDLEDRRLLVHDPLEAVRLEIASRSGKEEPSRLVLAKNRDQAWEVEEPPKRAKDLDEVSIGALIQNLSQLRYTNKSERQFEGPDVSILFEGDKGRPLAALEIKKIDDGPLLARRPGESQVFEIEELALAGLPEPWAIGKNKN